MANPVVHQLDPPRNLDELSRDELIELLEQGNEGRITIDFKGKANARQLARRVRPRIMRTVKKYSSGAEDERARNLLIEGDNLQAMATLYRERGQVDLMLTDPPYNTGNDWRYNDRWEDDPNDPGLGEWVSEDDGARHTKWMRFMWPRLQMMKSMLKPGGVLAICIDHRELFRLGQMLDELFKETNRLAIINWQRSATRRNDKGGGRSGQGGVSVATEYILVYARDRERAQTGLETRGDDSSYRNPDDDPQGDWYGVDPFAPGAATHPGMVYAVQSPFTGQLEYPPGNKCWAREKAWVKAKLEEWGSTFQERDLKDGKKRALLLKGAHDPRGIDPLTDPVVQRARDRALSRLDGVLPELFFTTGGEGRPRRKAYLEQIKQGLVPTTFWASEDHETVKLDTVSWAHSESGTSEVGARELGAVLGSTHGFETVKPLKLFKKIVQLWCPADGLVLDAFAGSGTTGHAVLEMNQEHDLARRFILIEQGRPDRGDSYARSLMADRLRRVVTGDWKTGARQPLGGGFRFATLERKVDAQALLSMEREDLAETIIASHFDSDRRRRESLVRVAGDDFNHLVARNSDNEGFFLIWNGPTGNTDFTEQIYEECAVDAQRAGLGRRYHVYARLYVFQTTSVVFYQIPDRILTDFGLDLRGEPYHENEANGA